MSDLTLSNLRRRSLHVMIFIRRYFTEHGYPPPVQEICDHFKMQRQRWTRFCALSPIISMTMTNVRQPFARFRRDAT